jgi:hypothetical protein
MKGNSEERGIEGIKGGKDNAPLWLSETPESSRRLQKTLQTSRAAGEREKVIRYLGFALNTKNNKIRFLFDVQMQQLHRRDVSTKFYIFFTFIAQSAAMSLAYRFPVCYKIIRQLQNFRSMNPENTTVGYPPR